MTRAEPGIHLAIEERARGRIARLEVDHPGKLNVLNRALMQALVEKLEALAVDETLRVLVLSGRGESAFIGGADIREMAMLDPESARAFITLLHRVCAGLRALPVPVIARIRGWALGAGLEVAAACDLRMAAEDARFGMPEVKVGIPSVIEAALLPPLIGWGRTRRLLLTGETIDARAAERWGLVERVAAADELDAAIEDWIAAILGCGPQAIRRQKALMREWEELTPARAIERGIAAFADAFRGDEPRQRMADFLTAAAARRQGRNPPS
ncbi:MAG TPA: enoyl-CoA hydratase [Alphaproteobacteria bacterium]|nr:enoyl-CoA hydratase [Alphaproteobacteria bacterium]